MFIHPNRECTSYRKPAPLQTDPAGMKFARERTSVKKKKNKQPTME